MTAPLRIAVVIPCRNDGDFLDACLAALAAQSRPADRVIVVDNDSTDDSVTVAQGYGVDVVSEPEVGIWPAAARGYDEARGTADVIARLDADSRPHPDWLERIEAAFAADDELGVLTGGAEFYGAGPLTRALGEHWYIGGGHFWVGWWLGRPLVFGSNFAMRARTWEGVRGRVARDNPRIHDDLDLTIRLRSTDGIRLDRTLRMPVSARPFATIGGLLDRVWRVPLTFAASWPEGSPRRARRPVTPVAQPDWTVDGDDVTAEYGS